MVEDEDKARVCRRLRVRSGSNEMNKGGSGSWGVKPIKNKSRDGDKGGKLAGVLYVLVMLGE
jgi:hypothetical protein